MIIEAVNKIEQEIGIANILNKLYGLPQQIRDAALFAHVLRTQLKDAQATLDLESGRLLLDIQMERDPTTGKPAYSNAEARSAELARRQATDAACQAAADAVRNAEHGLTDAELDAEMLRNELVTYRALAELAATRLKLYA